MTHHDAFLADIVAHPGDDTPRLVYADWLEEQGDPASLARAEFIRVQCLLVPSAHLSLGRVVELRKCERKLLEEHWHDWVPDCISSPVICFNLCNKLAPGEIGCLFRRGFISNVSLSPTAWHGERCPQCLNRYPQRWGPCGTCHGSGHLAGVGPRLIRLTPLEHVELSGLSLVRNPHAPRYFYWHRSALQGTNVSPLYDAPLFIIKAADKQYVSEGNACKFFSAALLRWAGYVAELADVQALPCRCEYPLNSTVRLSLCERCCREDKLMNLIG